MNSKKILQFSIGPIGAAALSLITLPFVAWFFSAEDVGRLTMLQVVVGLSVSLFSLAMHQAYVREYHEEEDKEALFKMVVIPGFMLLNFITLIICFLPFSITAVLFGFHSNWLTLLLIIAIYSSFVINFLAHVVRMEERGVVFSATQIAPKILLLFFIGSIFVLNLAPEFKTLMLMNTLAVFISLLIFLWLTRKTWEVAITAKINWIKLKKMLTFSLPLVAGGIAYWGLTTIDRFFLRHYVGFDELGVYALSVTLAGAVFVASSIFSNLWHPILYQWVKNGIDEKKVQRVIENMTLFVSLVWSIIGSLTFVAPYFFPPVYASIEYLIVACVAMPLFYMLAETTGVGIGIKRRSIYGMAASIVALIVNILLNFVLIPSYGTAGAALATLISFFIFFTVKTEASSVLWCSLPRIKIYLILLLYMLATSIMVIYQAEVHYFNFVWLLLLLLTCVLFYSRVSENVQYLYKQLINRS